MRALLVSLVLVVGAGVAEAYPQFQLSRDQTCTGCHLSPAGGGLLNENGLSVAESISQFGTAPEFFYNERFSTGSLIFGGDVRLAAGYFQSPESYFYYFPMQGEVYARYTSGPISLHVTAGIRPTTETNEAVTTVWSREHYLTWQSRPDETAGLYIRAGRFMPVFGLRFAEHPMYTRRYGGTQLFTDTYGLAVEYVDPKWELHVTGFVEDYAIDPVEHANGAAMYAEVRPKETLAFGVEAMYKNFTNGKFIFSDELDRESESLHLGVTNKLYLQGPDLLLQTELQFINQIVDKVDRSDASRIGGAPKGLLGSIVVSKMLGDWLLLDVGLQHYDSNYRIANQDRDAIDVNVHWFTTSHLELILNTRYELIGFGKGGDPGAYAMLQAHYRL